MNKYETYLASLPPKPEPKVGGGVSGHHHIFVSSDSTGRVSWGSYMEEYRAYESAPEAPQAPRTPRPIARAAQEEESNHDPFRAFLGYGQGRARTRRSI